MNEAAMAGMFEADLLIARPSSLGPTRRNEYIS